MEKDITINEIISSQFSRLDQVLVANKRGPLHDQRADVQILLKEINKLGVYSARVQGLSRVLTCIKNIEGTQEHVLYLLKDAEANCGHGELVGLLKMGNKKLFLYDNNGKLHELNLPCLLDFFIIPKKQRQGYGLEMFKYMLKDLNLTLQDIAIDGPSLNLELFLKKHFGVKYLLRQNNNFAVVDNFFKDDKQTKLNKNIFETIKKDENPLKVFGRFAAQKRGSSVGAMIHGEQSQSPSMRQSIKAASGSMSTKSTSNFERERI